MSETKDTLDPEVNQDTQDPEQTQDELKKEDIIEDPSIDVDAGDDDETIDDTAKGAWFDALPPEFREDPDVTKYKSLEEYVKGNREVRKMVGKDKLVVPTDKSTPDEVNEFWNKLGRPESADKYTVPATELPDGLKEESGATMDRFKGAAHEVGITDSQFQKVVEWYQNELVQAHNQEVAELENLKTTAETKLRGEWGAAYQAKVDGAQKVINHFFKGQEMHKAFGVLANDQGFIRAMAGIADKLGEDVIEAPKNNLPTPKEAQVEVDSIMAGRHDLSKAYFDDLNPEHKAAVERVLTLQDA